VINPRYQAFANANGLRSPFNALDNCKFIAFIADAMQFANEQKLGVVSGQFGLRVVDHDKFTLACQWYAVINPRK